MANYHVNYNTGSDATGNGSAATPWATVSYALSTPPAVSGDKILVAGSTKTTVDAAASLPAGRSNVFTTSIDTTGDFNVGDLVLINPNIPGSPEYNDWIHCEVEAITATTLTARFNFAIPKQENLTFTLQKYNDVVENAVQEDITGLPYTGVIIEGGYDNAFTTVVGHTQFLNTTQAVGARSGRKFKMLGGSVGDWSNNMPYWLNMSFSKYQQGIECSAFGVYVYANNLVLLNANARPGGNSTFLAAATEDYVSMTYLDCDQKIGPDNVYYFTNGVKAVPTGGAAYKQRVKIADLTTNRKLELGYANIDGATALGSSYGPNFGENIALASGLNASIEGPINMIGLSYLDLPSNYTVSQVMCGNGQFMCKPSLIKVTDNGDTAARFNLTASNNTANVVIELPTGVSNTDFKQASCDKKVGNNAQVTVIDGDGTVRVGSESSSMMKSNTTEQSTGDSCLEISQPFYGYESTIYNLVAQIPVNNGGLTLDNITTVAKRIGTVNPTVRYYFQYGDSDFLPLDGATGSITTNTTYSSSTISTIPSWVTGIFPNNIPVYIGVSAASTSDTTVSDVFIDSITPTYS